MYGNKSYLIDVDPRRIYGQHKFKSIVLFSVCVRAHDVSAAQIAVLHARARDGTQLDPRPSHGLSVT